MFFRPPLNQFQVKVVTLASQAAVLTSTGRAFGPHRVSHSCLELRPRPGNSSGRWPFPHDRNAERLFLPSDSDSTCYGLTDCVHRKAGLDLPKFKLPVLGL